MRGTDDHPEDLKALLRKRFGSLAHFDAQFGLPPYSAASALRRPHRRAEETIARALGRKPHHIWPSRYAKDGTRLTPQPTSNYASARGTTAVQG